MSRSIWEKGKKLIPLKHLITLAKSYKVSLDYITGLSNNDKKMHSKISDSIDIATVSDNLKTIRKKKHLTQTDVAECLKTTQSNIHKYETGKCLITTMYALEFARHFSCSLDELLGRK